MSGKLSGNGDSGSDPAHDAQDRDLAGLEQAKRGLNRWLARIQSVFSREALDDMERVIASADAGADTAPGARTWRHRPDHDRLPAIDADPGFGR